MEEKISNRRYYEDELAYLRELGSAFGRANPQIAGLLSQQSHDPDIERLMEAFAFLTAKLRQRLEEGLPELAHGVMALLAPYYLRPLPAMSIVELTPAKEGHDTVLPSGSEVLSVPVESSVCSFQTCGDVPLVPAVVSGVRQQENAGITRLYVTLSMQPGASTQKLASQKLRLFLGGGRDQRSGRILLHMLMTGLASVEVMLGDRPHHLGSAISQAGFAESEAMLPWPANCAPAYRILLEYLAFPDRFLFVDLPAIPADVALPAGEVTFVLTFRSRLELPVELGPEDLRLNCVPVVNLFRCDGQPIRPAQDRVEYLLLPALPYAAQAQIFNISAVWGRRRGYKGDIPIQNFNAFTQVNADEAGYCYSAHIRQAVIGYGSETWLSFMDMKDHTVVPQMDVVSSSLLCTNGALAARVPVGGICRMGGGVMGITQVRNIVPVYAGVSPPLQSSILWRLVSGLLRTLQPLDNVDALRLLIEAHDFRAKANEQARLKSQNMLASLAAVRTEAFDHILRGTPVRGRRTIIELQRTGFSSLEELYLFATAMDAFLGVYASVNSVWCLEVHDTYGNIRFVFPVRQGRTSLS
ncbi:type VI secretion system baseplate subunit TssF [Acetobacter vaccinii]|uniref:Type VI secretion system baseplate subunit TssF n=1 Tax=Acetobacter vaccinii TaxID=2592655 RepID=A0A5C1YK80_9PROT|nr:type VI secretion system baseplate subunit TssF [Acetobacter vaccinii]QEO16463.1 type VI secretion system baseplate subunit TssF [Acetobacter vaccinii]